MAKLLLQCLNASERRDPERPLGWTQPTKIHINFIDFWLKAQISERPKKN